MKSNKHGCAGPVRSHNRNYLPFHLIFYCSNFIVPKETDSQSLHQIAVKEKFLDDYFVNSHLTEIKKIKGIKKNSMRVGKITRAGMIN